MPDPPTGVLAHIVVNPSDLPLPLWLAQYGTVAVLLACFVTLRFWWRAPRPPEPDRGLVLPGWLHALVDAPATRGLLRAAGLGALLATLFVAATGPRPGADNPAATWLYVWLWSGIVPASLLLGPVWRALNPLRAITAGLQRVTGRRARPLPARLGRWPAAAGVGVFAWLLLVSPDAAEPGTVLAFLLIYSAVHVTAAAVHGPGWYAAGDAFEVVSSLLGRLSPVGRRADGRLVVRAPSRGAARAHPQPGEAAVLCALLGATAFDELRATPAWAELTGLDALFPSTGTWLLAGTAGLLGCAGLIAVTYLAAVSATPAAHPRAASGPDSRVASGPSDWSAACLLPIAAAYMAAHTLALLVVDGRFDYLLASQVLAWGLGGYDTTPWMLEDPFLPAATVTLVQLGVVVAGHALGVVLAYDRALASFPAAERFRGQYPLLMVMVAWAFGGVTLLVGA